MHNIQATSPVAPERDPGAPAPDSPAGDPKPERNPEPWHDPGPPVRKVNLPPDSPSPGVPVPGPENPRIR